MIRCTCPSRSSRARQVFRPIFLKKPPALKLFRSRSLYAFMRSEGFVRGGGKSSSRQAGLKSFELDNTDDCKLTESFYVSVIFSLNLTHVNMSVGARCIF